MSLSAWEQQTLDSIKDELSGSDPGLVALLATFTRHVSDEAMPMRERLRPSSRRTSRPRRHRSQASARPYSARPHRRLNIQLGMLLLLLLVTVGIVVAALVFGHSTTAGTGSCMGSWPTVCSHPAPG